MQTLAHSKTQTLTLYWYPSQLCVRERGRESERYRERGGERGGKRDRGEREREREIVRERAFAVTLSVCEGKYKLHTALRCRLQHDLHDRRRRLC